MRKRELVHLHALLDRIRRDLQHRGVVSDADLSDYRALGVSPTAVHESKTAHEAAVEELTATLAAAVDASSEQAPRLDQH